MIRKYYSRKTELCAYHENKIYNLLRFCFRMFRANEDIRNMFVRFRHLKTEDEIRVSELVEKHAISVMGTLDELISNIDNVDYVFDVLKATGQSHMKFPGFRTDLIWVGVRHFVFKVVFVVYRYKWNYPNFELIIYMYNLTYLIFRGR